MKKIRTMRAFVLALGTVAAGSVGAAPVSFGSSSYEFVASDGISWADANAAATGTTYLGLSGYLASVTSAAENAFLAGLVTQYDQFAGSWLGAMVANGPGGAVGTWAGGPEAGQAFSTNGAANPGFYANWGGIEPNNSPGKGYMNLGPLFAGISHAAWADAGNGLASGGDPVKGYFVEFSAASVPLPAGLPLVLTGVAGLAWAARRRRFAAAA